MKMKFNKKEDFIKKYNELIEKGIRKKNIKVYTPFPVSGLHDKDKGKIKYFALIGSLTGFVFAVFLTVYTTLEWNEVLGGKPPLAFPAFIVIYYELIILFGGVLSFIGFLLLNKLPDIKKILDKEEELDDKFVIEIKQE